MTPETTSPPEPPPPPPPPEGHVGVYKIPAPQEKASLLSTFGRKAAEVAAAAAAKAKEVDEKYDLTMRAKAKAIEIGQNAKEGASVAAANAATKAKEVDERYQLSNKTKAKASELGQSAKEGASAAFASLKSGAARKTGEASTAVARKVGAMTPEERQRWLDGAVSVAACATAFGGSKTKAVAGVASFGIIAAQVGHNATAPPPPAAAAAVDTVDTVDTVGTAAPPPPPAVVEVLEVQVVASVPAGGVMHVHVEGVGAFELTVPAGVAVGDAFIAQIEAPLDVSDGSPPDVSDGAVPVGLPPTSPPPAAAPPPPPPPAASVGALGALAVAAAGGREAASTAGNLATAARELDAMGVTPQQALSAGVQGARLVGAASKELGVTPQQALSAGLSAVRWLGAAQQASQRGGGGAGR